MSLPVTPVDATHIYESSNIEDCLANLCANSDSFYSTEIEHIGEKVTKTQMKCAYLFSNNLVCIRLNCERLGEQIKGSAIVDMQTRDKELEKRISKAICTPLVEEPLIGYIPIVRSISFKPEIKSQGLFSKLVEKVKNK